MGFYDVVGAISSPFVKGAQWVKDKATGYVDSLDRSQNEYSGVDRGNFDLPGYQRLQGRQAGYLDQVDNRNAPQLGAFANAGVSDFASGQRRLGDMLMDRAAGNNSVAEMQLKQGLEQGNRQQMSMMAGARPHNAALAMMLGSQNMANNAMGMSGAAAQARAQEAQQAAMAAGNVFAQGRQASEGLNMFNAGQQNARTSQQAQMQQQQTALDDAARGSLLGQSIGLAEAQQRGGMEYEQNRTGRYASTLGVPTQGETVTKGILGIGKAIFGAG